MGERRGRGAGGEEEDISREEVRRVIGRVKKRKAMGIDGLPNEVWKYGGERMVEWAWRICGRIWKSEG